MSNFIDKSRKFRLGLLCMILIVFLFSLCGYIPVLDNIFADAIYGLIAIYAIYCGLNVANKGVLGKFQGATVEVELEEPEEESE